MSTTATLLMCHVQGTVEVSYIKTKESSKKSSRPAVWIQHLVIWGSNAHSKEDMWSGMANDVQ